MAEELRIGLSDELSWTAEDQYCITRGEHVVFSTPSMVNLLETVSEQLLQRCLPPYQSSVGARVDIRHLAPTPRGLPVRAVTTVREIDRRRVIFEVDIFDPVEKVGEARHERFIIDLDRFGQRLAEKLQLRGC